MDKRGTSFRKIQVLNEQRWYQKKEKTTSSHHSCPSSGLIDGVRRGLHHRLPPQDTGPGLSADSFSV